MMRRFALVLISLAVVPAAASAQGVVIGRRVKQEKPPPTPATFEERNAKSPLNQPCKQESLALPLISALSVARPKRVPAGEFALPQYGQAKLLHRILWRIAPWDEKHAEFIEQHRTLKDRAKDGVELKREKVKLYLWCEKNNLPHCAEFVMRDFLYTQGKNIASSLYRTNTKRWKSLAIKHPSPYTFRLPLSGEWHALVDETGHHQKKHWAVFACDIVKQIDGRLHVGVNVKENHFAWQQPVFAVCDGIIIQAKDKYKDHMIGRPGPGNFANIVRLDCGGGIYADYAHLRQGSVIVKKGDKVKRGQMLGRVGNSGASGVPHLHFTMSDADGFSIPGRYHFSVLSTNGWAELNGAKIEEGWHFSSID